MAQSLDFFLYLLWNADWIVWCVAALMSLIAGVILQNYSDDTLLAVVISVALFVSIMIANVAFTYLGIMFMANKNSNMVAAAGAAVCSVTVIALVAVRLINSIRAHTSRFEMGAN